MNKHLKHIFYLSVWTLTAVVVWVSILIFSQSNRTNLEQEVLDAASPLSPSFDRGALDALKQRTRVNVDLSSSPPSFSVIESSGSGTLDEGVEQ